MATQTPNLGLDKPAGNERPLIGVLNGNADKIDAAIGDVDVTEDGSLQDQIDSIKDSVSYGTTTITIPSGQSDANKTIQIDFTPSVVIATAAGGNTNYSRVTAQWETNSVKLFIFASGVQSQATDRDVFWVAFK